MQRVLQRVDEPGAVVGRVDRKAQQRVVARLAFLEDALLDARDTDAADPAIRELASQRNAGGDRVLIVGFELLLDGAEIELELLVATKVVGLDELRGDVVAQSRGRASAEAQYAGG